MGQLSDTGIELENVLTSTPHKGPEPTKRHADEAAAQSVRQLLDDIQSAAGASTDEAMPDLPDVNSLPQRARNSFALLLNHVQHHPDLIATVDGQHRVMLMKLLAASSCRYVGAHCFTSTRFAQGSYPASTELRNLVVHSQVEMDFLPGTVALLGGHRLFKRKPSTRAEVHAAIVQGLPYSVLFFLTDHIKVLSEADVANVVGISSRTLRRQKEEPKKAMPTDLASRTWLFAEALAKATDVFGGKEEAERWMSQEAMGLDGARPIDLLRTVQGAELVKEFLGRLEHGVYN